MMHLVRKLSLDPGNDLLIHSRQYQGNVCTSVESWAFLIFLFELGGFISYYKHHLVFILFNLTSICSIWTIVYFNVSRSYSKGHILVDSG